jgi:putative ABC transport system permease protein
LRSALIVGEIALAVVLLAGAGLLLRSFAQLVRTDPGFRTERLLSARLNLPPARYDKPGAVAGFAEQLTTNVRSLPGANAAAAVSHPPFSYNDRWPFAVEGQTAPEQRQSAANRIVSPNYYEIMGVALKRGRVFTEQDRDDKPGVVIVNEAMARKTWGDQDPLGKRIIVYIAGRDLPMTVVGVVADSRQMNLEQPAEPEMNFPMAQMGRVLRRINIIVRGDVEPMSLLPSIRGEVWKLDSQLPLYNVTTLRAAVDETLGVRRFVMCLLGLFALVALVLAISGIYGVIGHAVAQRTHEIGIRMALGARRQDVLRMILGEGGKLALTGVAIGIGVSCLITQWLRALLYGVSALDPLTFILVALLLLVTAMIACWIPARRASRVDPMIALRAE